VVIIAISDPVATRQVVSVVREENPKVHIIARTRYAAEMKPLYELGANEVIPEEFETSVEIFTRILGKYLVPQEEIEKFVAEVRADGYQMLRSLSLEHGAVDQLDLQLPGVEISSLRVSSHSPLVGKTLIETDLRQSYGVTVLAVQNRSGIVSNPEADIQIHSNDLLLVIGKPEQIAAAASLTKGRETATASQEA
jgi:CPA2 family monovalent cation:H+ antiporter-2